MKTKQKNDIRVWRVTLDSPAGIMLQPDTVTLVGGENNFIHLNKDNVIISSSKLSFTTDPMNISKGILFKEMMGFMQSLPSSIVMPIPNIGLNIPGMGMLKAIKTPLAATAVASGGSFGGAGATGSF